MVSLARELGHCDGSVYVCVERGRWDGGSSRCRCVDVAGLGVVAEEPLVGDHAVLVGHLDREVGAWVDGCGLPVFVGNFIHVDFVEDDFDAHTAAALGIVDEDEFAPLAVGKLAEQVVVGWALGIDVVVHGSGDGGVSG